MHVIVSWDISAEGDEWKKINESMKKCLEGYSWVKPLTTFYIIQVGDADDRSFLKDDLVEVCEANPSKVNFVISPVMQGGSYGGWLPKRLWPKIKTRTK